MSDGERRLRQAEPVLRAPVGRVDAEGHRLDVEDEAVALGEPLEEVAGRSPAGAGSARARSGRRSSASAAGRARTARSAPSTCVDDHEVGLVRVLLVALLEVEHHADSRLPVTVSVDVPGSSPGLSCVVGDRRRRSAPPARRRAGRRSTTRVERVERCRSASRLVVDDRVLGRRRSVSWKPSPVAASLVTSTRRSALVSAAGAGSGIVSPTSSSRRMPSAPVSIVSPPGSGDRRRRRPGASVELGRPQHAVGVADAPELRRVAEVAGGDVVEPLALARRRARRSVGRGRRGRDEAAPLSSATVAVVARRGDARARPSRQAGVAAGRVEHRLSPRVDSAESAMLRDAGDAWPSPPWRPGGP